MNTILTLLLQEPAVQLEESKQKLFAIIRDMGVDHPFVWILCVLAAGFVAGKIMNRGIPTTGLVVNTIVSLTLGVLGGLLVRWICKLLPVEIFHNEIFYVWFLQGLIGAILIYAVINRLKR